MRKLIAVLALAGIFAMTVPAQATESVVVAKLHIAQRNHASTPKSQDVGVHVTNGSRVVVNLAVTYQRSGISTQPRTVLGGVSVYPGKSFDAVVTVPRWRYTDGLVTALVDRAEDGLVVTLTKLGPTSFKDDPRRR